MNDFPMIEEVSDNIGTTANHPPTKRPRADIVSPRSSRYWSKEAVEQWLRDQHIPSVFVNQDMVIDGFNGK